MLIMGKQITALLSYLAFAGLRRLCIDLKGRQPIETFVSSGKEGKGGRGRGHLLSVGFVLCVQSFGKFE